MFSEPMTKVDNKPPYRSGLALAAGLAFMALLAALYQVVNGQVEQAGLRQAQHDAAQAAISGCAANYSGAVRRLCIDQVNARLAPYSTYTPTTEVQASAEPVLPVQLAGQGRALAPSQGQAPGMVQAAFASH
ncbi:MAG: hypothetical protein JWP79_680 [Polaromonas sp.]|jgi:hypothetical protein|nr:hypothetical protein [Polaromonas sp.]MDB5843370.1 hypothetical protein [Polaromonas sp.]